MRIITGTAKGLKLKTPRGRDVRPTSDRVKESLFAILGDRVAGAAVADLFAGTGNLGLEALSRGGASAVFVDASPAGIGLIRDNAARAGLNERAELLRLDAIAAVDRFARTGRTFDLIFCDPPYNRGLAAATLEKIDAVGILNPGGTLIIEHSRHERLPDSLVNLKPTRTERYGETTVAFFAHTNRMEDSSVRIAVCPGSFDPVTNGHLDIFERASIIFDQLIVAVFHNPNKKPLFTMEERVEMLRATTAHIANVRVDGFSGLLNDYVRRQNSTIIVRGLRALSDFEYEFQRALLIKKIDPQMETVFMMTTADYSFVSSTGVKELAKFGGNIAGLVPDAVTAKVLERLNQD